MTTRILPSEYLTTSELEDGLPDIRRSPRDQGTLIAIVRRPEAGGRESVQMGQLSPEAGLVGDSWRLRRSRSTADRSPNLDMQISIMNARLVALFGRGRDCWHLSGDQLFVDLDLSSENLPAGTRLCIGESILEITAAPHRSCAKFAAWFGVAAQAFVLSATTAPLRLRGINARVVRPGSIQVGDPVIKVARIETS